MREGYNDLDPRDGFSELDVSEADMRAHYDSQGPAGGSPDLDRTEDVGNRGHLYGSSDTDDFDDEANMRDGSDPNMPGCGSPDMDLTDMPDEYHSRFPGHDQSEEPPFATQYHPASCECLMSPKS